MTASGERGSVTVLVAVLVPALVACAGLVLDGGRMLSARREAQDAADAAARVAAGELVVGTEGGGRPVLAALDAEAAGAAYLQTAGYEGEVSMDAAGGARVEVSIQVDMVLLDVIGVGPRQVVAVGRAEPVFGVGGERP